MAPDAEMIRLSQEWAIVVADSGTVYLTHLDENEARYHLALFDLNDHFKDVDQLHEGIRMIRSQGTSPLLQ